mgnify:CR=1 FL=1
MSFDPFAPTLPTLDALVEAPTIEVEVEGRTYRFAELSLAALGRLQEAVKSLAPHPLQALKPHLAGLPTAAVEAAVAEAVRLGRDWPPRIGTAPASAVLTGTPAGLVHVLHEGLRATSPTAAIDDAGCLLNALERDVKRRRLAGLPAEAVVSRVLSVLFGNGDPETARPKA